MPWFDKSRMLRVRPGCYIDAGGALHIDAVECLEAMGVEPSPENQQRLVDTATELFVESLVLDDVDDAETLH